MKPSFPLGISSYALRWSVQWNLVSAESALETAARAGAQVVQICENLAPHERPERELRELAALAAHLELTLELGAAGCTPEHLRTCLRTASLLNARILRMVLSAANPIALPALESTIRASLPELHERGICLAIENHFDLAPRDLKLLVETIGSPQVGICLDVFNSVYHLASQAETIAWLAPLARTVHVKDVNIRRQNTGFYLHGCRLGEGRLDLEGLLLALSRAGHRPALLVESWMDRLDSDAETCLQEEAWLRDGIQFLKQKTTMEGSV
jgi:3-oxoisoapionate decarboxylase